MIRGERASQGRGYDAPRVGTRETGSLGHSGAEPGAFMRICIRRDPDSGVRVRVSALVLRPGTVAKKLVEKYDPRFPVNVCRYLRDFRTSTSGQREPNGAEPLSSIQRHTLCVRSTQEPPGTLSGGNASDRSSVGQRTIVKASISIKIPRQSN